VEHSKRSERVELLAPAGDRECLQAAVENGADAVYFGLQSGFNARARAANFQPDELPGVIDELHRRGRKGYLTLNTLVFPDELEAVEQWFRHAVAAGIDAVLVQDLGLARVAQQVCPEMPLHASTQMSLTSAAGIREAQSLGIRRVVLARELSVDQIRSVHGATDVELEVFVHGALCISYSGQCLASLTMGGRSGNRGQCAQPCRMPYGLARDGQPLDLGEAKYVLSPLDLAAIELLPELVAAGVRALKIEGRLKTAEYVAAVTRHYRAALDAALDGRPFELGAPQREELELSFSRGFSVGWLHGPDHRGLVPGTGSANRGVYLGVVRAVRGGRVAVELAAAVKRGDGLVFQADRSEQQEQGGRVYEVFQAGQSLTHPAESGVVELTFGKRAIDFARLRPGQRVWKTDDAAHTRRVRKTYTAARPQDRLPVDLVVEAAVGSRLRVAVRTASGVECRVESEQALAEARQHPLTDTVLREQFQRLGGTVYELRHLQAAIDGRPMVPLSLLGKLRHEIVRQLDAATIARPQRPVTIEPAVPVLRQRAAALTAEGAVPEQPIVHVLCRSREQIEAVLDAGLRSVIVELADLDQAPQTVELVRRAGAAVWLAAPRIEKPGEEGILELLAAARPAGIVARNLAGLGYCRAHGMPAVADFSLHAANPISLAALIEHGACRGVAAYDLDRVRLLELAGAVPPGRLEVVLYRHTPLFHTEYCLFCAQFSRGAGRADCGRPCRTVSLELIDRLGEHHRVSADACCRNTVYHGRPQDLRELAPALAERGVRHFRIELLEEAGRGLTRLLGQFQTLGKGHR
jgi:putative protease